MLTLLAIAAVDLSSLADSLPGAPRPGGTWQVPACSKIADANTVAFTADEGATLAVAGCNRVPNVPSALASRCIRLRRGNANGHDLPTR